jgi:uncharacterized protein
MLRLLRALVFLLIAVPAAAQNAKPYLAAKSAYGILVIGDGIASGMGSGIARLSESDQRLSVDGRYEEDSGLARPDNYDWVVSLPKILDSNPLDIVVVQLGSNDSQELRDRNFRFVFGTPDWEAAYRKRVDALIAVARSRSAAIYWVGPPPMAATGYDRSVAAVAALIKERVEIAKLRYIDIRKPFTTPGGNYAERGADETGVVRRLRARDGVHFLKSGNNRLGQIVLAVIKADVDAAQRAAPIEAGAGPAFGQDGATSVIVLQPGAASPNDPVPGTSAAKLFLEGQAPDPQPGRFDDFSLPAK